MTLFRDADASAWLRNISVGRLLLFETKTTCRKEYAHYLDGVDGASLRIEVVGRIVDVGLKQALIDVPAIELWGKLEPVKRAVLAYAAPLIANEHKGVGTDPPIIVPNGKQRSSFRVVNYGDAPAVDKEDRTITLICTRIGNRGLGSTHPTHLEYRLA